MKNIFIVNIIIIILFIFIQGCGKSKEVSLMEKLSIEVKDSTRAFSFTNKKYGQYYGKTNSGFNDGWQGWTLREQRIFNDYEIRIDNSLLDRSKSTAFVYPHLLKRNFPGGINEQFFFADNIDLINIRLKNLPGKKFDFSLTGLNSSGNMIQKGNTIAIDISNIIPGYSLFIHSDQKVAGYNINGNRSTISFDSPEEINLTLMVLKDISGIDKYSGKIDTLINQKEKRIEKLLTNSYFKTNDEEFNKALMWAKVSLDALITTQEMKGIFAGLPWFNNYWGRDTFISLPGAALVTGNYADAKDILLSFAKYQDKNPSSKYYGRIPNRITLKEKIYNTADGTPWFVIQAHNYFFYTNDILFLGEIYPAVKLAYEAAVEKNVDQYGFLTHEDQETWMDAVGPEGPWSPRGNRAVDIQALWYKQLIYSSELAYFYNDTSFARKVMKSASLLRSSFQRFFVDNSNYLIYDRIKKDNTPDKSIRPNQFIALNEVDLFPSSVERIKYLTNAVKELVYPYGVLSLSQNDVNFHPYHDLPPYYVKDAAYHNGIIWQWNTGPVVQLLSGFGKQDMAWFLTKELTNQILNRGSAGTLAELSDALPRKGEKNIKLSGAFSQAWSLAEYIRNFYQDYLGVRISVPDNALYLIPTLPANLNEVEFTQRVGSNLVGIKYLFNDSFYRIIIDGKLIKDSLDVGIGLMNKADANYQFKTCVYNDDKVIVEIPAHSNSLRDLKVLRNRNNIKVRAEIYNERPENLKLFEEIKFATPELNGNLKTLKGPDYSLLENKEIKKVNKNAVKIFEINTPDKNETYQYPTNTNFIKGILDLTKFSLYEDNDNYYFTLKFKKLNNPGWHNEYGFQLTFASICIQTDEKDRTTNVKMNSNYNLPPNRAFSRIINIGGGFDIRDAQGRIIAAYIPKSEDFKNPLGNTANNSIEFSISKKYIGTIKNNSKLTILVGAQDDHGGAGLGEFRNIGKTASEWQGGGKDKVSGSNVYDELFIN